MVLKTYKAFEDLRWIKLWWGWRYVSIDVEQLKCKSDKQHPLLLFSLRQHLNTNSIIISHTFRTALHSCFLYELLGRVHVVVITFHPWILMLKAFPIRKWALPELLGVLCVRPWQILRLTRLWQWVLWKLTAMHQKQMIRNVRISQSNIQRTETDAEPTCDKWTLEWNASNHETCFVMYPHVIPHFWGKYV
jgi:hypothetical protein